MVKPENQYRTANWNTIRGKRILNRSQKHALEHKYTYYVHGETAKLRYKAMLVFTAWSVTLLFVHGALQLLNGSVLFVVGDAISDLKFLPYLVSGLVTLTVVITLLAIREYRKVVKTVDGISQGSFPPVEDKPPFSILGVVMIFGSVLVMILYMSILVQFMWSNWLWNVLTLSSLIMAILAVLVGYSAGISAYALLRRYKGAAAWK